MRSLRKDRLPRTEGWSRHLAKGFNIPGDQQRIANRLLERAEADPDVRANLSLASKLMGEALAPVVDTLNPAALVWADGSEAASMTRSRCSRTFKTRSKHVYPVPPRT
jgi:hypothetical protein